MKFTFADLSLLSGPPAGGAAQDPTSSMISTIVMFGLVFVVFYFLIIRPQNKKQKNTKKMLAALKKGDKVQTIGGIRATVQLVKEKEDSVILKVDENTTIEFARSSIANVLEQKIEEDTADSTTLVEAEKKK
jgi:preprotein translocase subunit YajC